MKEKDYQNKELQSQIRALHHQYDEKTLDLGGKGQIDKLKQSLRDLRDDIQTYRI